MADTNFIKKEIEPFIVDKLAGRYKQPFSKILLPIGIDSHGNPRQYEFDAVSEDRSIVAGIKSYTGKTSGGNRPAAKISGVYKEIFFLSLVRSEYKLLVLTDSEFFEIIKKEFNGILPERTAIIHIPVPKELQKKLDTLKGRND